MRVKYGSTWVAPGGLEGTSGFRLDHLQSNEEAALFRAAAGVHYPRGGRVCALSFRVWRTFADEAAAIVFAATHLGDLAVQEDLQLFADDAADDAPSVELLDAIPQGLRILRMVGCAAELEYSFAGGLFTLPP